MEVESPTPLVGFVQGLVAALRSLWCEERAALKVTCNPTPWVALVGC